MCPVTATSGVISVSAAHDTHVPTNPSTRLAAVLGGYSRIGPVRRAEDGRGTVRTVSTSTAATGTSGPLLAPLLLLLSDCWCSVKSGGAAVCVRPQRASTVS